MILIDGVKYRLWTPKDEEKEFHPMIKEHSKEIFGENSLYFDIKHKLISKSGIGSIPDAYVITLSKPYKWYVIENELASHSIYDHIVKQLTKFINGLRNPKSRNDILEALDYEIRTDKVLKAHVEKMIGSPETFRFLSKLLSHPPNIVVVIDELNEEVREACQSLRYETQFVEFKTFVREDAENVHAHLFEPIYTIVKPEVAKEESFVEVKKAELELGEVKAGDTLELVINTQSHRKYALFYIPKNRRRFFPGYKIDFILETDIGEIKTRVSGGRADMPIGDLDGGDYFSAGLREWYNKHPELTIGRKVRFECIEPYKRYRLVIV
jgi:hypothetical protein